MSEVNNKFLTIMVVAGENSGDVLAAGLVAELKTRFPNARFIGVAGNNMRAQGVQSVFPLDDLNVMGLVEVLPQLRKLFAKRDKLVEVAKREKIDLLLTVDFQDFNASLAKKIKAQCKVPCIHYVSPTVWAWRRGRIPKMARYLDHLLVLFPFEPEMYYGSGLKCTFVGHPVAQNMRGMSGLAESNQEVVPDEKQKIRIALLPGSRKTLIKKLLPTMLRALHDLQSDLFDQASSEKESSEKELSEKQPGEMELVLPIADPEHQIFIEQMLLELNLNHANIIFVSGEQRFEVLASCKAALAASGTSNLELAMLGLPMLVVYSFSPVTYWLVKPFVNVPYGSPVNWVAGKQIVPELLQGNFTETAVREGLKLLLKDSVSRSQQLAGLKAVREALGENQDVDASFKAAEVIATYLNN